MYDNFANVYDSLTLDVDYKKRTEYLLSLFEKFDKKPTLLLDLACGTGGFSFEMAKKGISVIGVDISEEMLAKAKEKQANEDVLFLCQDATELDLYGTVDGAICCLDSLNHITDYNDFATALSKVSLFLEKDRLFIFDMNTEYKHKEILGDNTFVFEDENLYCVWQNEYSEKDKTVEIFLDFFKCKENGLYERCSEYITERAYTDAQIKASLSKANLKIEAVFEEQSFKSPTQKTQRKVYITRKAE